MMLRRDFDIDLFPGLLCDQRQNGRCWVYASLAPFRQRLGADLSTNYVYYFDQLRKSEAFLRRVEETGETPLSDPALSALLREPVSTVGQWCYFASIAEERGLVPLPAMPDTPAAENSYALTQALCDRLRLGAWELRSNRAERREILAQIEGILRGHLGAPPETFFYRDAEYTPRSFYEGSGIDLKEYVTLIHHPSPRRPFPRAYHEEREEKRRDPFLTLLSVDMTTLKTLALRQLQQGEQVVIGADVRREGSRAAGELCLRAVRRLPKRDAIAYRQINACHVMSIDGWAADGRWRVQDSHGAKTGPDGHYVMTDGWFDEYVLSAVIRKAYLSPELRALLAAPDYMPKEERF